jgi:broad specificity phosphatase PhoE
MGAVRTDAVPPVTAGSPDPLTMNTADWFRLTHEERAAMRPWLEDVLGTDWQWIDELTIGEGFVTVRRFAVDAIRRPRRDANGDYIFAVVTTPCPSPPPVWKPLR